MESEAKECRGCRFFDLGDSEAAEGYCRRRSPRPRSGDQPAPAWWPIVHALDWCGEWRAVPLPLIQETLIEFEPEDGADLHEQNSVNAVPPSAHGVVAREDDGEVDGL